MCVCDHPSNDIVRKSQWRLKVLNDSLSRFVAFIIYSNWYWYTREMCPLFNETFKLSTVSAHIIFTWSLQTQNTMSIIVVITHIEMTEFFFLLLYLNLVIFYSIELLFSCNVCLFSLSFASSIHILIRIFRISFIQSFDLTISWSEEKRSKLKWSEVKWFDFVKWLWIL